MAPLIMPGLAVLAGLLSFTSPCTLPLVPGYLGYMSGVRSSRGRTAGSAALFVIGFALVFTALGAAASELGSLIFAHKLLLTRLAGIVIITFGVIVLGLVRFSWTEREARPLLARVRPGPRGSLLLGVAFALGWTPCIGPMLGSILTLAASRATLQGGVLLLLLYSLGLGIPFLGAAIFLDRFTGAARWVSARAQVLNAVGGLLLIAMGILVLSGSLNSLLAPATELYARSHWPPI